MSPDPATDDAWDNPDPPADNAWDNPDPPADDPWGDSAASDPESVADDAWGNEAAHEAWANAPKGDWGRLPSDDAIDPFTHPELVPEEETIFHPSDQPAPEGCEWKMDLLGQGGNGKAYLLRLVKTGTENVVRHLVVKTTEIWHGESDKHIIQSGPGQGQLWETYLQNLVNPSGVLQTSYTVPVNSAEQRPLGSSTWRIYMPFFPLGDLSKLLANHTQAHAPLPEPFLWFVFQRLAGACIAMDEASRDQHDDGVVVHFDIKSANILVDSPGNLGMHQSFPAYPVPYLADFGLAEIVHKDDPEACKMTGRGTRGIMAPEIFAPSGTRQAPSRPLVPAHSWTNVWQIGRVMLSLLDGAEYSEQIDFWLHRDGLEYDGWMWRGLKDAGTYLGETPTWSKDLTDLVKSCLQFHASARPSPQRLFEKINELMTKHTQGMDRWGTLDWFNEQNNLFPDIEQASRLRRIADGFSNLFQGIFCWPRERRQSYEPISEQVLSPRQVQLERRRRLVARQIKEGRKLNKKGRADQKDRRRYSKADKPFVLASKLQVYHAYMDNLFGSDKFWGRTTRDSRGRDLPTSQ